MPRKTQFSFTVLISKTPFSFTGSTYLRPASPTQSGKEMNGVSPDVQSLGGAPQSTVLSVLVTVLPVLYPRDLDVGLTGRKKNQGACTPVPIQEFASEFYGTDARIWLK